MVGPFGGLLILAGLVLTIVGHRHMGESPIDVGDGGFKHFEVPPAVVFYTGLALMGIGLIIGISALVNGADEGALHYSDFFPESSK